MDPTKMNPKNPAIPTPFRGLRILLLDNDTSSLLDISSKLEDYSYKVTTAEVPKIALTILQERVNQFDLVIADINTPELDCLKFIKSVNDIKNLPIILMSAELKKDVVEEAITKGACFFLKKPISSKSLKNVWQHVCRNSKNEKSKAEIKQEDKIHEKESVHQIVEGTPPEPENEQIGDSDEKDMGGADEKRLTKMTELSKKKSVVPANDEGGKLKRKRKEEEEGGGEGGGGGGIKSLKKISRQVDSTTFMTLLQQTDTINGSELSKDSHLQTKFPMSKKQKMDLVKESGSST